SAPLDLRDGDDCTAKTNGRRQAAGVPGRRRLATLPAATSPPTSLPIGTMRIQLDYGKTGLEVNLPDERLVGPLAIRPTTPLPDAGAAIVHALSHPIGSHPLAEI